MKRRVFVGPYEYRVILSEAEPEETAGMDGPGDSGSCTPARQLIWVGTRQALGQQQDALLHELMHAVWDAYSVGGQLGPVPGDTEEGVIRPMSTGMLDVLSDRRNRWVREFLGF